MSGIDYIYSYDGRSSLAGSGQAKFLRLASDKGQPESAQTYLKAKAIQPDLTAKALRAISEIVGSRFYVPPAMLARILREADPVATVGRECVRFEGFSACCSVYARLDLEHESLEVEKRRTGTTNVDFGPELRALLAQVKPSSELTIGIGSSFVDIAHEKGCVTERKVPLPLRWLKGFAEVQGHLAGMEKVFSLPSVPAQRFLRTLPRSKADHLLWVSAAGNRVRTMTRKSADSVPLRGAHRLRVLETLASRARYLNVYGNPSLGSSAWELDFGSQRFTLVLNAEPWRGFSGDGRLLSDLVHSNSCVPIIRAHLNWQDSLDLAFLGHEPGVSGADIRQAISHLAAIGQVGFDLSRNAWFHRQLPFGLERLQALNPRLKSARALFDSKAVTLSQTGADVVSENVTHRVRLSQDGYSCTCPWYAKHQTTRGPCKHVLAVEMELERLH